jgi:hypothetical protein
MTNKQAAATSAAASFTKDETVTKFAAGQSYKCRSACDSNCVWTFRVMARTAATITTECGNRFRINRKLTQHNGVETVLPFGNYSMCPILRADKAA